MTTSNKNFTNQDTPSIIDTHYFRCNFAHTDCIDDAGAKKGSRLFPGNDTPRTFEKCNMVNCEPPPGSTVIGCNTAVRDPEFVIDSEDIIIDGEVVGTANTYVHRKYGKYNPDTELYEYLPTPIDTPVELDDE